MVRAMAVGMAAVVALATVTACSKAAQQGSGTATSQTSTTSSTTTRQASSTGPQKLQRTLHTDTAALTAKFPALGTPEKAVWAGGLLESADEASAAGDPAAEAQWLDAVIVLAPSTAANLRALPGLAPVAKPEVLAELTPRLPAGPLVGGASLDAKFATPTQVVKAYLSTQYPTLILTAVTE
jgi:hypothetical protein